MEWMRRRSWEGILARVPSVLWAERSTSPSATLWEMADENVWEQTFQVRDRSAVTGLRRRPRRLVTAAAYFNVWQRHAAEDVGLNMLHIINETIAAATAHRVG